VVLGRGDVAAGNVNGRLWFPSFAGLVLTDYFVALQRIPPAFNPPVRKGDDGLLIYDR
jgi:hypothetical protein